MNALTIPQVAGRLNVHRATVYRLIAAGDLAVIDVRASGKKTKLRVPEASLQRFEASRQIKGMAA